MAMIDERGRIAGRVNVIDLAAVLLIIVAFPIAYGAYLLFRSPEPTLIGIEPKTVHKEPEQRVIISGQNLRPYLRVSFNTVQGKSFLIGNTKFAQVDLPDLEPGTYDVVLFDFSREVARLKQAFIVLPLAHIPLLEMIVSGSFKQVPEQLANDLKVGTKFPPTGDAVGEILSVGPRRPASFRLRIGPSVVTVPLDDFEVPATLKVHCYTQQNPDGTLRCEMSAPRAVATVAPDSNLTLAGPQGWLNFQIEAVHLAAAPATARARVRFVLTPEILARLKVGDADVDPKASGEGRAATIVSIGAPHAVPLAELGPIVPIGGGRIVDVGLRVPVEPGSAGWVYKDAAVRAGETFSFATAEYAIKGEMIDVTLPDAASRAAKP
jgi:uncharacterized protein DUF4330